LSVVDTPVSDGENMLVISKEIIEVIIISKSVIWNFSPCYTPKIFPRWWGVIADIEALSLRGKLVVADW
jgi:hypothetical protein